MTETDRGIDGTVELIAALERLSATSQVAASAPRSKALYRYLADGMASPSGVGEPSQDEFTELAWLLMNDLSIWWSVDVYAAMPVMTPWCVRDRSCRYDQGPEEWGAPREDGFLRDDNSIIKKLPLPVSVAAPSGHPYDGRKPWRGFTACHIWRDLPGGAVAGEDPWLYSFVPNLVWLPSWLSPLTDRQDSHTQELLQRTSLRRYRDAPLPLAVEKYAEYSWGRLVPPGPGMELREHLAEFAPDSKFVQRRLAYLDRFVEGCDAVLSTGAPAKKLICSRYTAGLPLLSADHITAFRTEMASYRDAVEQELSVS